MTPLFASVVPVSPWLPVLVFVAELCVVTIGTVRIIFISRGMKVLAPVLGFFEITIWLFAIGQIMQNLNNWGCYVGFAGGFTIGNFLGVMLEKKLAIGKLVVRIITPKNARALTEGLQAAGFGVTSLDGQGANGPVKVVFTIVRRKELAGVVGIIKRFDANAFYSVDDLQSAASGIFPAEKGAVRKTGVGFGLLTVPGRFLSRWPLLERRPSPAAVSGSSA